MGAIKVVKPLLKWAGSKRLMLPCILSVMPRDFRDRRLHEPFFGAGALTFWMKPKGGTINDINQKLMNFYFAVRDTPEELIEDLKTHKITEEYYYKARAEFNELVKRELPAVVKRNFDPPHVRLASLFLYLNKTSFNGLYRENTKGEFNVPYGRPSPKRRLWDEHEILNASKVLANLDGMFSTDFEYVIESVKPGDIVYLDPPYFDNRREGFSHYTNGNGFSLRDQIRLRNLCAELNNMDVYFILSNANVNRTRRLYEKIPEFEILNVGVRRFISGKAEGRQIADEILVTNIPEEERIGFETAAKLLGRKKEDIKGCSIFLKS